MTGLNVHTLRELAASIRQPFILGCRELDVRIWMALNRPDVVYTKASSYTGIWYSGSVETILNIDDKLELCPGIPNYTTSHDDAIRLFVKMLPEWCYTLVNDYFGYYRADLCSPFLAAHSTGMSMPLAICAATLLGLAEEIEDV